MGAIAALGMTAEGRQEPMVTAMVGSSSPRSRQAEVLTETSTARRQGLERTTAGQETSQRKATLETAALLSVLAQTALFWKVK